MSVYIRTFFGIWREHEKEGYWMGTRGLSDLLRDDPATDCRRRGTLAVARTRCRRQGLRRVLHPPFQLNFLRNGHVSGHHPTYCMRSPVVLGGRVVQVVLVVP